MIGFSVIKPNDHFFGDVAPAAMPGNTEDVRSSVLLLLAKLADIQIGPVHFQIAQLGHNGEYHDPAAPKAHNEQRVIFTAADTQAQYDQYQKNQRQRMK